MMKVAVSLLFLLSGSGFGLDARTEEHAKSLLKQIEEGREHLKKESVQLIMGTVGTRRIRISRRRFQDVPVTGIVGREMALAILDADGMIRIARAIKRDPGFEVLTPGFILSMRRENGINSDIACLDPPGGKVVAVKYPEAYAHLHDRGVLSRAFPGRRVVDVIPKDILRVLLLNEHIDPGEFKSAGVTKPLVERVLTVIATNRDKAYAYSISPAGARGLVQMMPSTYSLLLSRYTSAGLKSSFAAAVADPINAVMSQVLLCDSDWESIRARTDLPVERVGPYLAAAYNGGVGRVLTVLSHDEMDWMEEPDQSRRPTMTIARKVPVRVRSRSGRVTRRYVVKKYTQAIFKNETSKYVSQYHWINDYLAERAKGVAPPVRLELR